MLLGEYLPNAPSLSGVRLSTSCPLRLVGGGLPQMPLEPTREQQGHGCVNSPHDLERVKGAFDMLLLKGGLGATPM